MSSERPGPAGGGDAIDAERVAKATKPGELALALHPRYRGKVQTAPKVPVRSLADFSIWYSPGVASPCNAIVQHPELVYEHTNKGNTVAIVSDGTRVLGLGDIGPEAGLPVMEGKALIFKMLGGVDAVPLCLATKDEDEIVRAVRMIEPSFGGVNLEDIAQPKCFRVLERLRAEAGIPVWHDDQQGTATVLLGALRGALAVVGKELRGVRIAMIGAGAANMAAYRLLRAAGVEPAQVIMCDTKGILTEGRADLVGDTWREKVAVAKETRPTVSGGVPEALRGADVCIAFSAPEAVRPEWVRTMAKDAIVFACANPVPEIWPWLAKEAGARVVGTGRSDFANQVNNSLVFPGLFRGVLDVRARAITDEMAVAASDELARLAVELGLSEDRIVPPMTHADLAIRIAVATGTKAVELGLARVPRTSAELHASATAAIASSRAMMDALVEKGVVAPI